MGGGDDGLVGGRVAATRVVLDHVPVCVGEDEEPGEVREEEDSGEGTDAGVGDEEGRDGRVEGQHHAQAGADVAQAQED